MRRRSAKSSKRRVRYHAYAERIKEAEKKRRERLEDVRTTTSPQMAAKQRVREQIEEDKRRRAEKAAHEKAMRQGQTTVATPAAPSAPLAATLPKPGQATETRLRVRTSQGQWTGTLPVSATLAEVETAVLGHEAGAGLGSLTVRSFSDPVLYDLPAQDVRRK